MEGDPYFLQFVPDWFLAEQQIEIWADDDYYYDDDELIEWYNRYKNGRVKKQEKKSFYPSPGIPSV